jgi:hypothetical protein
MFFCSTADWAASKYVCPIAASGRAFVLWQRVLPLLQKIVLFLDVSACLFYSSLCCLRMWLSYSSLCSLWTWVCSIAACAAPGLVYSTAACSVPGCVSSTEVCAAPERVCVSVLQAVCTVLCFTWTYEYMFKQQPLLCQAAYGLEQLVLLLYCLRQEHASLVRWHFFNLLG